MEKYVFKNHISFVTVLNQRLVRYVQTYRFWVFLDLRQTVAIDKFVDISKHSPCIHVQDELSRKCALSPRVLVPKETTHSFHRSALPLRWQLRPLRIHQELLHSPVLLSHCPSWSQAEPQQITKFRQKVVIVEGWIQNGFKSESWLFPEKFAFKRRENISRSVPPCSKYSSHKVAPKRLPITYSPRKLAKTKSARETE